MESWLILGEVVAAYVDKSLIRDGVYQTTDAHPILRAGRLPDSAEIRPEVMFEMLRQGLERQHPFFLRRCVSMT